MWAWILNFRNWECIALGLEVKLLFKMLRPKGNTWIFRPGSMPDSGFHVMYHPPGCSRDAVSKSLSSFSQERPTWNHWLHGNKWQAFEKWSSIEKHSLSLSSLLLKLGRKGFFSIPLKYLCYIYIFSCDTELHVFLVCVDLIQKCASARLEHNIFFAFAILS